MIEIKRRVRELGPMFLAGALVAFPLYLLVRAWLERR
jgi:hypothetical protein